MNNICGHEEVWSMLNRRLVAKAIGELAYEQVITPIHMSNNPKHLASAYLLELKSGVTYRFQAWQGIWDYLRVQEDSLERAEAGKDFEKVLSAGQFFIDCQQETEMSSLVLGNFLEELSQTLSADFNLWQLQRRYQGQKILDLDDDLLQACLDGHPKALLNKGRLGWGQAAQQSYAPESLASFQLYWLALNRAKLTMAYDELWSESELLSQSLSAAELEDMSQKLEAMGLERKHYHFMPVHPWQWDHVIQTQFAGDLAQKDIVPLGYYGDEYRPQISLRTLANKYRPKMQHIKLPLSILNTSCVRGIPAKYIPIGPRLSQWLADLCKNDPILSQAACVVLQERAGLFYHQQLYSRLAEAPYRYHELLGAVWRDSPASKLKGNEKAALTAALFQKDAQGGSWLSHCIAASGLEIEEWLSLYFKAVIIPLYHLQIKYGIGIVAHGQNIAIRLTDYKPSGMFLKDFQGDLRLVDEDWSELSSLDHDIKETLTRLPAHYLIHDLQTGHFVTVLRFVSATLYESTGFKEIDFYRILAEIIADYENSQAALAERFAKISLLRPKIPRVLINKVRFKIGYGDSSERPLPMLGTDLDNPLFLALESQGERHVNVRA